MIKLWYTIQAACSLIVFGIIAILVIIGLISAICFTMRENRKEKWLKEHGFVKELTGVAPYGDGRYYSWIKRDGEEVVKIIRDPQMQAMTYKKMVEELS